jgi:valyl-tRNA synthetase
MLGDTAVAVNPEDDRNKHLIGKTVMLPIMNREIPIIADQYVDKAFGSGCVKITPAHDPNDFEMGKRHSLPLINILNKDGSINENGGEFQGQDRFVARKNVLAKLEELGLMEKIEDYTHTVPYSERGKVPVEPLLSIQWFVKIKPLSDFALEQFDKQNSPTFVPDRWGKVYRDWLIRLKDWCISRQLWWGHQIPAWYAPDGTIFVAKTEAEAYTQAKAKFGEDVVLERDPDVLDTWFSSGLWPFSTLGWPEQTQDFETFYPTSVLVTGFDIIFFWVARMTMMAGYFTGKMPFHTVYIHGLVRDENNQKMSKSKNNGIDPLVLINKYGVDALRYSLVKEVTGAGQDIRLDYNRKTDESTTVETARNFANKLWNASRFVMMNLNDLKASKGTLQIENLELADRWILSRYYQTILQVREQLDGYSMGEATKSLYEFFWGDFCDWYIELVKSRLQEDSEPTSRETVQQTLAFVLDGILRLLHPFMPHVTEEIWQLLTYGTSEPSSDRPVLAIQPYPEIDTTYINTELEEQFELLIGTIRTIRNLRAEAEIKPSVKITVILQSDSDRERTLLEAGKNYILDLAKVEDLAIVASVDASATEEAIAGVVGTVQAIVSLVGVVDIGQLIAKLERTLKKLESAIASAQGRLNNEGYVKKAPPEVVETARAELEESLKQQEILKARLAQLQGVV